MDNLENLDNKTLRAKCLEYGLPDIPITDTSKKLLIKRLRAAMESGAKPADKIEDKDKQKTRRETIHVIKTKAPSEERSKSPSRRKTIDPTPVPLSTTEKSSAAPAQIIQRRRSGRMTPSKPTDSVIFEPVKTKIKSTTIEEESDDIVYIEDDDEKRSRPASRQSRASSLSTAPIVTTTYAQNMKEPIIEVDDQEEEEEEEVIREPRYVQKTTYNYESTKNFERRSYIPTNANLQRESLYSSRINQLSSRPTLTTTAPTITSFDSTSSNLNMNRRYTTSNIGGGAGSIFGSAPPVRTTSHLIREDSGDEIEKEAPYLSDFTRKLTRLKAEPVGGVPLLRKDVIDGRSIRSGYDSKYVIGKQHSSVGDSLKQLCVALDDKYGLKKKMYIAGAIMIFAFIYIVFYQ